MSTYVSFPAYCSYESPASMTSACWLTSNMTKIASKTSTLSSRTSSSSFTPNASTSTSNSSLSSSSFQYQSQKTSAARCTISSSSSSALSLLSTPTRSSISTPSTYLEEALHFTSKTSSSSSSSIPLERLETLVQRYDEALHLAAIEREAVLAAEAAYQAKLEAHWAFVDELHAKVKADKIAALTARLSPCYEISDMNLKYQFENSVFAGARWSLEELRHPIIRKGLELSFQADIRDCVDDEVVDCWIQCWSLMGYNLSSKRMQKKIEFVNALRKSVYERKNRTFAQKVWSMFC